MKLFGLSSFAAAVAASAVLSPCAMAEEWIHLDPIEGEAVFSYDGFWRRGQGVERTVDFDLKEGVRLRQSGYSLDRKIATFALEIEPTFSQGKFKGAGQDQTRKGNFLNFNGNLSLLHGTPSPISLSIRAARTSGITDGSLGNRTDFVTATRRVALNWKTRLLPTTLSYDERVLQQSFRSGLTLNTSERDDLLRTLAISGRNSKLNFSAKRQWLDDRVADRNQNYTLTSARAGHNFKWGKGSQLTSRIDFADRKGFNANRRLTVNESARIQHTKALSSTTAYNFFSFRQFEDTTEHRVDFRLRHLLYQNLTSVAYTRGALRNSDLLDQDEYEFGANFSYQKSKLFGANVSATLGGSYRRTDRRSDVGLLSIVDESHLMPLVGIVVLEQRFIDISTVIVTDATGTLVLAEGIDYEAVAVTDDFTEVRTIPSGRIQAGDTILVSYRYASLPSLDFSTVSANFTLAVDFGWIKMSHQYSRSDQTLLSGIGASFLTDRDNTTSEIELKWSGQSTRLSVRGERRVVNSGSLSTRTYSLRQSIFYSPLPRLSLTFSASEIFARTDERSTTLYTIESSAIWRPGRGLTIRPHMGAWMRKDAGSDLNISQREEQFLTGGFDLRWNWRKIRIDLRYNHNLRGGDINNTSEDRVMVTLRRKY